MKTEAVMDESCKEPIAVIHTAATTPEVQRVLKLLQKDTPQVIAGMIVFENEKMSLLQQTALYFMIACAVQFIPAWICGWMEHSLPAVLTYVMVSVMFSALIWIMIYAGIRHTVRNMNQKLKKQ